MSAPLGSMVEHAIIASVEVLKEART